MSSQELQQSQELKQNLSLNPHRMALGRYLEMSGPELEEAVRRVVDDNPALVVAEEAPLPAQPERQDLADDSHDDDDNGNDTFRLRRSKSVFYEPADAPSGESLADYLLSQLAMLNLGPRVKTITSFIVGSLDSNGYLRRSAVSLADDLTNETGEEYFDDEMQRGIDIVKKLDPRGVGASGLRECLLLQLQSEQNGDEVSRLAHRIINRYFDDLGKKHYEQIEKRLGISRDQLREALLRIRQLNPKPGAGFENVSADDRLSHISPDFYVAPADSEGRRFDISLLNTSPELQIEESFRPETFAGLKPERGKAGQDRMAFIRRKGDEAADFIRLLDTRNRTLLAVVKAIVSLQRDFFLTDNPADIRPMILKDVAALTGFSLSMISRAASGKYIATPSGVYPLKMFFNEKPRDDDEGLSRGLIEKTICEVIEREDPAKPLSDGEIADILREKGVDIARRTVAKHREKLSYPVARLRKKI